MLDARFAEGNHEHRLSQHDLHDELAKVLTRSGQLDLALATAEDLARRAPAYAHRLGLVHEERQDWQAALAAYDACLHAEGTPPDRARLCVFSKGYAWMKLRSWEKAAEAFAASAGFHSCVELWRGQCLLELGRFREAVDALRTCQRPEAAALLREATRRMALDVRRPRS